MSLQPEIWMDHPRHLQPEPNPHEQASIVEYLRWMRILRPIPEAISERDKSQIGLVNNGEILELLYKWEGKHDHIDQLQRLTGYTRRIATISFEVKSPWRIRVGGQRGPESMLLPAFDAVGLPYLPSTTLKGVARGMAQLEPKVSEDEIKSIFGTLEPKAKMGRVIFLDAYPTEIPSTHDPEEILASESVGLVPDMANSLWTWSENGDYPSYKANPNIFLTLRHVRFVVGLRRGEGGTDDDLQRVRRWLLQGMLQGIGSRVNSGYGILYPEDPELLPDLPGIIKKDFLRVEFTLKGQLIHGRQLFTGRWIKNRTDSERWNSPGKTQVELRPIAFRSILRYWFRTLSLGILTPAQVFNAELEIFGGIHPTSCCGFIQLILEDEKLIRDNTSNKKDEAGSAKGTLVLRPGGSFMQLSRSKQKALWKLLRNLMWLASNLGGVGQGARRPCYSRQDRANLPYWRGSSLQLRGLEEKDRQYWQYYPKDLGAFRQFFRSRLIDFYQNLLLWLEIQDSVDLRKPHEIVSARRSWIDALDRNSTIIVVKADQGDESHKPPSLELLHKLARIGNNYDVDLCGSINQRSPIWIAHVPKRYDVVTIFDQNQEKRSQYKDSLLNSSILEGLQVWGYEIED